MLPLRDENPHPPGFKPKMTILLIIINAIVFFFQVAVTGQFFDFSNANAAMLFYQWGAVPACIGGADYIATAPLRLPCPDMPYVTLISSMFMHGGLMHFGGNMLYLWIFGDNIELRFGKAKFLGIYLMWGIVAGLAHMAIAPESMIPAVGASGAISGVLGAYLVIYPKARILTLMFYFFIHVQARWFLPFWLIFQNLIPFLIGGFGGSLTGGGVAFMAHIGGFAIGVITGIAYKKLHRDEFTYGTRYGWRGDY